MVGNGYVRMDDVEEPTYVQKRDSKRRDAFVQKIEEKLAYKRDAMILLSNIILGLALVLVILFGYSQVTASAQPEAKRVLLLVSIPVVALFFTWFHIWLAIKMMFLPTKFVGIHWKEGMGLGWQGVVPRKATKMARTAFACARPHLMGPRDWFQQCDPCEIATRIRGELTKVVSRSLCEIGNKHFPGVYPRLPDSVKEELVVLSVDQISDKTPYFWKRITDIIQDPERGMDNDRMFVSVFSTQKDLLNDFFMKVGAKELKFIEHCGAALGLICGIMQLLAYNALTEDGRVILMPSTGFFLGIFTNWLAIQMCFKPLRPRPVYFPFTNWKLCTLQGVFMARQREASAAYSQMLVEVFFNFGEVLNWLQRTEDIWEPLKKEYLDFASLIIKEALGSAARVIPSRSMGKDGKDALLKDIQELLAYELSKAEELQEIVGAYIQDKAQILKNNYERMAAMPVEEFENLLHPVFQEDEWILILLGGLLGAIVGFGQIEVLKT
mmetsp:Transcript_26530/g.61930  ORF Transcript_26530/g.61930 Transcript_26530/m.61930 type:complete len:496 (+) Transcript_26530:96-1583(+)